MSAARPAVSSVFSRRLAASQRAGCPAAVPVPSSCHHFHSSAQLRARRRPRFRNILASDMGLVTPEAVKKYTEERFPEYTSEEKEQLRKRYSPEQLDALEAGEAAISSEDLARQGRLRVDPYRLPYIEDFSTIRPVVDKRPKTKPPYNPKSRFMKPEEFADDTLEWLQSFVPKDINLEGLTDEQLEQELEKHVPSDLDILKWWDERSSMTDKGQGSNTALAPTLPNKVPGVAGLYKTAVDPADEGLDDQGIYQNIKKITGLSVREILSINVKILVVRWVHNQTRLGKIRSSSILSIAGNGNGWLGLGVAKSTDHGTAVLKSRLAAIRNMKPIPRYENRTIYGNVEAKVAGSIVQLFARPPGFGLRVSHRIFEMCRAAGIHDLAAKMPRSRNPMNTVKATYQALLCQPDPEQIAIGRGKKLVDVRKVYYGGNVY